MSRKPKTERVPRTRAGGEWTEAAFWGFLRSGLRQMSRRWPARKQALQAARVPYTGENRRRKWSYRCSRCGEIYKATEVEADHIIPCGSCRSWEEFAEFGRRLFCEAGGMRVLCKACHQEVTNADRQKRRESMRILDE